MARAFAADDTIVTWCVGHLVSMSYPDAYDPSLKKWSMATIPFIPSQYKYQVIDGVKKQFGIVKRILTDPEVGTIYICTDSGREGEYIYRLVAAQAGVRGKKELRVWIDSQTEEEILRGIREAKPSSAYDNLGSAAYLRAQEDYLMGINFSRALTLRYSDAMSRALGTDHTTIAVGRVMTCVLGMVVRREREIRSFVKTPFFRVQAVITQPGAPEGAPSFTAQWQVDEQSICCGSPRLYRDTGFLRREDAEKMILYLTGRAEADIFSSQSAVPAELSSEAADSRVPAVLEKIQRKKEKKNPPLLYNLAELQNDCSRFFKISPDQTLAAAQELYEKKLTTYPRTDARVLSSAACKEIEKNILGLGKVTGWQVETGTVLTNGWHRAIAKNRKYVDDSKITDHYAIIPTGEGTKEYSRLSDLEKKVYELIVRRFISIFYPPAVYDRVSLTVRIRTEAFTASLRTCVERGYLDALDYSFFRKKDGQQGQEPEAAEEKAAAGGEQPAVRKGEDPGGTGDGISSEEAAVPEFLKTARKGTRLQAGPFSIREGETSPPKRYTSGSMILAMENAGQLIEEEELREQIRGSGIGTSATRAEILKKLFNNDYLRLNSKTQVITPSQTGEMIFDTCSCALRPLLDPRLTASWELGLTQVAEGTVTSREYTQKLNDFIARRTNYIKETDFHQMLIPQYARDASLYPEKSASKKQRTSSGKTGTGSAGTGARRGSPSQKTSAKKGSSGKRSGKRKPAAGKESGS